MNPNDAKFYTNWPKNLYKEIDNYKWDQTTREKTDPAKSFS